MGRSDNGVHVHPASPADKRQGDGGDAAVRQASVRKPALRARFRLCHWSRSVARPGTDTLPETIERGIAFSSRIAGPVLLLTALVATIWGLWRWLG